MSSSPTYTIVDQFDEGEFPDVPKAPAALLAALNTVPDPGKPRGLRHGLVGILAIAACAVIAGARSFAAIAEWAAAASPAVLAKLGVTGEVRCESTFRRTINKIDANGLDLILGAWTALRAVNPKEIGVIAVDGKSLRGSATVGVGVGTCSPRSHIPAEWSSNNSTSMSRRTRSPFSQHSWTTSNCLECSSRQTLCIARKTTRNTLSTCRTTRRALPAHRHR